ncbi:branched-chain amino acid ABC transporter permease [Thermoflexus hugenholtzii]|uniref:Branched-chain amino acid transport system permease protein n=1 Tax=Thermoflexus hugenholtzii JAD2 TaxID=877466 RepID=A0A212RR12_9CHLR|nr:branched-chain amino acid ABC transporter permease [Thermoflexus hugenholtzii]SNB74999.1 branched-chain amino acid transport system permease protein [Thermoflexus hugenholtzii JAD2]
MVRGWRWGERAWTKEGAWRGGVALAALGTLALLVLLGRRHGFGAPEYLQFLLDGLRGGSIYALVALGFVLVYRVTGVINFAQGAFVMLGPMLTASFYERGWPPTPGLRLALAALLSIGIVAGIGVAVERWALYPARRASPLTRIIITVGVYLILEGAALLLWGPYAKVIPSFTTLSLADPTLRFGALRIKAQSLWIWGALGVSLLALALFFGRTTLGKAMRACAVNRLAAQLMGIRVDAMSTLAFGLAAALGAMAGIVLGPATRPTYEMGLELGLKGFVAAIMGGLVSFPGAVLGGLLLGALENLWAGVTVAGFKDLFAFIILILVLLIHPQGFAGSEAEVERT